MESPCASSRGSIALSALSVCVRAGSSCPFKLGLARSPCVLGSVHIYISSREFESLLLLAAFSLSVSYTKEGGVESELRI